MKSRGLFLYIVLGLALTAALAGCEYKSLDEVTYESQSLLLDYDWNRVGERAKSFTVAFYPADEETAEKMNDTYYTYGVYAAPTVINYLPDGIFNVTAWSKDWEYNRILDIPWYERVATTLGAKYKKENLPEHVLDSLYSKQEVYAAPDYILKANREQFAVRKGEENQRLVLTPDSAVVAIRIEIHGVKGLSMIREIRGTLNNVAKQRLLSYEKVTQDTAMVMFDFNFSTKDSLIWTDFYLYDIEPRMVSQTKGTASDSKMSHLLTLFFWLEGNNIFLPIDVTDQIANFVQKNQNKIVLTIDDIDLNLADYIPGMGGFDVNVDDWEDVKVEVPF